MYGVRIDWFNHRNGEIDIKISGPASLVRQVMTCVDDATLQAKAKAKGDKHTTAVVDLDSIAPTLAMTARGTSAAFEAIKVKLMHFAAAVGAVTCVPHWQPLNSGAPNALQTLKCACEALSRYMMHICA